MNQVEIEQAVEIDDDIFWVSQRNPKTLLQINTYLRRFKGNGKTINMLIDPGPLEYFSIISRKVGSVIQDISQVNMYSINHQDPDVGMNSTFLAKMNPRSVCLCSEDTWRLIRFFEIPEKNYKNVYSFNNHRVSLSTDEDHALEFVPTPYCHFVGAYALYDCTARVLFTGDLFGGLNPPGNLSLYASEEHWEGVKMFHQIYMPSNKAIRNAIDNIRKLAPEPLMIVPQHGAILKGDLMKSFLNRLYNLDVGMDLFDKPDEAKQLEAYQSLISILFDKLLQEVGVEEMDLIFDFSNKNQELMHLLDLDAMGLKRIFARPEQALNLFLRTLEHYHDRGTVNEIKSLAIKEALMHRLPMPVTNIFSMEQVDEDPSQALLGNQGKNPVMAEATEDLFN